MSEKPKEAWGAHAPYEQYVGRWSRLVAREFVDWLGAGADRAWCDVGCGSGALVEAILAAAQPAWVRAIDRSMGFLAGSKSRISDPRARFAAADAAALPWAGGSFDVTVSGLVLNFVPDPPAMAREMARVTRPGGTVALYVWDYLDGMEMMRHFWDVSAEVDPSAAALDEGARFPICRPGPLRQLLTDAGLARVETRPVEIPTVFRDFDDYWQPFLSRQGPAPTYLASVDEQTREAIRASLQRRLKPGADGSIHLAARAWAVRGQK